MCKESDFYVNSDTCIDIEAYDGNKNYACSDAPARAMTLQVPQLFY